MIRRITIIYILKQMKKCCKCKVEGACLICYTKKAERAGNDMNEITEKTLRRRENRLRAKEEKRLQQEKEAAKAAHLQKKADEKYMRQALKQAEKAGLLDEVPIGCVIVHKDKIIARGYNRRNTDKSTLAHAEVAAIRKASKKLSDWRLEECTLYVTLEPCQMCAGAIVQSRITNCVIGSMNKKAGCAGSILNMLEMSEFNHRVNVTRHVLEEECSSLLSNFFTELRAKKAGAKNEN